MTEIASMFISMSHHPGELHAALCSLGNQIRWHKQTFAVVPRNSPQIPASGNLASLIEVFERLSEKRETGRSAGEF